jgi:exodeoxyribonuclease-3
MKVLSWNIRHGGAGRRARIAKVIHAIDPDVVVLPEYRVGGGLDLRAELARLGWSHSADSRPATRSNGLLIASKLPIAAGDVAGPLAQEERWLHVRCNEVELGCIYLPGHHPKNHRKAEYWRWLLEVEPRLRSRNMLLIGDWNTGRHRIDEDGSTFHNAVDFEALARECGWKDAFRALHGDTRSFSWWSTAGNGFRLDHCFLSPGCAGRLFAVDYLQEMGGHRLVSTSKKGARRQPALSDHAALVVGVEWPWVSLEDTVRE